jgi:predicted SAM-dependent methyltransferase
MKTFINIGCGHRYHSSWTNYDIVPRGPAVIKADLGRGIPLPDGSADVIYHSAVLEHIARNQVPGFLRECYRVLKPGGVIRIAVPDLERICTLYLEKLQSARSGNQKAAREYDWMLIEMLDQCVRERSGGLMLDYLRQTDAANESFVMERIGEEGRELLEKVRSKTGSKVGHGLKLFRCARQGRRILRVTLDIIAGLFLGAQGRRALRIGYFRMSGEVHHWMYDDFSLARLLSDAGFVDPQRQTAVSSRIPNWASYNLDTMPEGSVTKPDLFYMESLKPVL